MKFIVAKAHWFLSFCLCWAANWFYSSGPQSFRIFSSDWCILSLSCTTAILRIIFLIHLTHELTTKYMDSFFWGWSIHLLEWFLPRFKLHSEYEVSNNLLYNFDWYSSWYSFLYYRTTKVCCLGGTLLSELSSRQLTWSKNLPWGVKFSCAWIRWTQIIHIIEKRFFCS